MKTVLCITALALTSIAYSAEQPKDFPFAIGYNMGISYENIKSDAKTELNNGWEKEYEPWSVHNIKDVSGAGLIDIDFTAQALWHPCEKWMMGVLIRYYLDIGGMYSKCIVGGISGDWWDRVWLKPIEFKRNPFQYGTSLYYLFPDKDAMNKDSFIYTGARLFLISYYLDAYNTKGVDVWGTKNYSIPISKEKIDDGMGYKLELVLGTFDFGSRGEIFLFRDQYGDNINSTGIGITFGNLDLIQ
jgi:hypothetical protein